MSTRINWPRVVWGGLIAGIIITASGVVLGHFVLGAEYIAKLESHLTKPMTGASAFQHIGIRVGMGMVVVFLYAGLRPRFGPGPTTALIAALIVWTCAGGMLSLTLNHFGILTGWRLTVAVPWSMAETIVAAMVGGWMYRERPLAAES